MDHLSKNRIHSHLHEIDIIGKLADLKEDHLQLLLWLQALSELLIERGILTREDIAAKLTSLNESMLPANHPTS